MAEATANFRQFARHLGCKASYVTELRKAGRLVLDETGKVRIADSIARIEATRDPAKAGVAARHAATRGASLGGQGTAATAPAAAAQPDAAGQGEPPPPGVAPGAPAEDFDPTAGTTGYQHWRERSERAKALALERDNRVADGTLLDAAAVAQAAADAITTLRTRLESLSDVLGPQLAAIDDESRARALLAGEIEHALDDCARKFGAIAKEPLNG